MKGRTLMRVAGAMALASGALFAWPHAASADAPSAYGWWYELNATSGLPAAPPAPPGVPQDGMYVANSVGGPSAISALSFTVSSGAATGPITLHITGSPTITSPPQACLATGSISSTEEGSWDQKPSYDCSTTVQGKVNSAQTTVTFDSGPFLRNGMVSVVILAGGTADSIAFTKPGSDAMSISGAGAPATADNGAGATAGSVGDTSGASSAPSDSGASSAPLPSPSLAGGSSGSTDLSGGSAGLLSPGSGASAATPAPGAALGSPRASSSAGRPVASGNLQNTASHTGTRQHLATALGVIAMLVALVAWTSGFGLLGGRITPLSVRVRPRTTAAVMPESRG